MEVVPALLSLRVILLAGCAACCVLARSLLLPPVGG